MRFRKLRIAWSVVCGILCVLLIVLWVRSYWYMDSVDYEYSRYGLAIISVRGGAEIHLRCQDYDIKFTLRVRDSLFDGAAMLEDGNYVSNRRLYSFGPGHAYVPYWMIALLTAALAAAPWLHWHFSLRTLLIAMTLIAVVLGLIIYLAKAPAPPTLDVGDFPSESVW